MIEFSKHIDIYLPGDPTHYQGTTVHQLAFQPESKQSLKQLEQALTWQDEKEDKHFQGVRKKVAKLKNGSPEHRANAPLYKKDYIQRYTPLVLAAMQENTRSMEVLTSHGAHPNRFKFSRRETTITRDLTFSFDCDALLISIQNQKLKSVKHIAKKLNSKDLKATAFFIITYGGGLYSGGHTDYYSYSYHYLFEALLTQNRELVAYFIEDKKVDPNLKCFTSISDCAQAYRFQYESSVIDFMLAHKLNASFVLWYGSTFGVAFTPKQVAELGAHFETSLELIGKLEHEHCPIQGPLLRHLILENDPATLNHLFKHYFNEIKELDGCLIAEAARKNKPDLLLLCLQHLVNFESKVFAFEKAKLPANKPHMMKIIRCAGELFDYKSMTSKAYKETLSQARTLGIIGDQPSPLTQHLFNTSFFKKNNKFKALLEKMLPKPAEDSSDYSVDFAEDEEGPSSAAITPSFQQQRQSLSLSNSGELPDAKALRRAERQLKKLKLKS